ncbi:MAG: nitrous oxide reductase accessory protein NosL, partial [Ferruginibacter sp.]
GKIAIAIITTSILISSCSVGPQEIKYGKDNCHFCKMTISDNRFATQVVTKKSKVYKFDDSHCVIEFLHSNAVKKEDLAGIYFSNFSEPHDFLNSNDAIFFQSEGLKSPMGGNVAAFKNQDSLKIVSDVHKGNMISWEELIK